MLSRDSEHYFCLIDPCSSWSAAWSLYIKARSHTFGAIVGSCKIHGGARLAKWDAKKLFHLNPDKPVHYAQVPNMYASEGYWSDVVRLHKMMGNHCHCKVSCCSWMDVAGEITPWYQVINPIHKVVFVSLQVNNAYIFSGFGIWSALHMLVGKENLL